MEKVNKECFRWLPPSTFPSTWETLPSIFVSTLIFVADFSLLLPDKLSLTDFFGFGETFGAVTTTYCFSTSVNNSLCVEPDGNLSFRPGAMLRLWPSSLRAGPCSSEIDEQSVCLKHTNAKNIQYKNNGKVYLQPQLGLWLHWSMTLWLQSSFPEKECWIQ